MDEPDYWRDISFPRKIGPREARTLCRYLVVNLKGDCYVSLYTDKHETFGERFQAIKPQTLEDVPLSPRTLKLSGLVTRTNNLSNIEFFFNVAHDSGTDRTSYDAMHLAQGVFDWDEMGSTSQALATDIYSTVENYFRHQPKD